MSTVNLFLFMFPISCLCLGTICSYSHGSNKGILSLSVYSTVYGCIVVRYVAWTHRCVLNDMSSCCVCGLIRSHSESALVLQLALRKQPQMPGVKAEHWTPPPPGPVYLSSHNALENRRQEGGGGVV